MKFQWDRGNLQKNLLKHGITNEEAESVFDDSRKIIVLDLKHSENETRYICIGKSKFDRVLYTAFTVRGSKYRIISCRPASKQNRQTYEDQ
ncbi:MAG: BrnT family toxin [Chitinophagales bacterium]|nr:BrnT family toxin [Chitinophagales bacterium]